MNKNAIGLHKFSRIFFGGDDDVRFLCTPRADCNSCGSPKARCARTLPPHAPCRLQLLYNRKEEGKPHLCLHTPRADCNIPSLCRSVTVLQLCLHTPRADCNHTGRQTCQRQAPLPPHAPCRLQHGANDSFYMSKRFASTRPVQIATGFPVDWIAVGKSLPPHAPCRLQQNTRIHSFYQAIFASTRPVQIATLGTAGTAASSALCLHTPRADCNHCGHGKYCRTEQLCLHTPRADCNGIPAS